MAVRKKARQSARPGDGTVVLLKSGWWRASISVGGRENRKRISRVRSTEAAAVEALRRLRAEHQHSSSLEDEPVPLDVFLSRWLERVKPTLRPKTWVTYELTVRRHIIPVLGELRVDRIRPTHIHDALKHLEAIGTSARMRELVYLRLRTALGTAVGGMIAVNPVKREHRPRVARKAMKTWTQAEARRFLEVTEGDPFGPLYRLALSVGMRRGELLGLRWTDVDLKARRLAVQHTLTERGELAEPKTRGSRRAIQLPAKAATALVAQKERLLAQGLRRAQWVFPDSDGEAVKARKLTYAFVVAIGKAKVPAIRFHDLRHTCASLRLQNGDHPKIVQELLGHSSISITLDLYSHVSKALHSDSADRFDAVL